jgi:hypothetical protein
MELRCWNELLNYGVEEIMRREYGNYLDNEVENPYHISLKFDIENVPPEGGRLHFQVQQTEGFVFDSDTISNRGPSQSHPFSLSYQT